MLENVDANSGLWLIVITSVFSAYLTDTESQLNQS